MATQTAQIITYDYGTSLGSVTLRDLSDDSIVATSASSSEVTADSGLYAVVFDGTLIPAGEYRLRAAIGGLPMNRYVRLAGVDGEIGIATNDQAATKDELDAAQSSIEASCATVTTAQIISAIDGTTWTDEDGNAFDLTVAETA